MNRQAMIDLFDKHVNAELAANPDDTVATMNDNPYLISHEHIYQDQASVLVQVGLLDPKGLPVGCAEVARKVRDPGLPSRRF